MSVGMPMPRLTYWPSSSSSATRAASCSLVSAMSARLPYGAAFDPLLGVADGDDPLHEPTGRVDLVGLELARLDEVLDLGDGDPSGGGTERVEVARGHPVHEIAVPVAL